mmetsp:Transcript_77883/g.178257  ORF Transcript_77883/g.178257 Transcript_77883/m.178257 type:complete len:229 (-) Transcript_77883:165-851(-)
MAPRDEIEQGNESGSSTPQIPDCEEDSELDGEFWCHQCVKHIAADDPIYMRNDGTFCSASCRERGVSKKYEVLLESAKRVFLRSTPVSRGASFARSTLSSRPRMSSMDSCARGRISSSGTNLSRSSIASSQSDSSCSTDTPRPGLVNRLLSSAIQSVSLAIWGKSLDSGVSLASMDTGLNREASMAGVFNYLPEAGIYVDPQGAICPESASDGEQGPIPPSALAPGPS